MRVSIPGKARRLLGPLSATLLLVSASASCVTRQEIRGQEVQGVDRKLSTFAYIEEGNLLTFIVDTRSTRNREADAYIPLEIALANRSLKELTITRESFTLVDEQGNRYPCAGPKELQENYEYLDMDHSLAELEDIVFNRFAAFTRYPSKFSPTRSLSPNPFASNLVRDTVVLPKFGYITDFIYFPKPKTGVLNHKFDLFLTAPELPDPVFVKFAVL
jgi:hypothetical protein